MLPAPAALREQGGGTPKDKLTRKHLTARAADSGLVVSGQRPIHKTLSRSPGSKDRPVRTPHGDGQSARGSAGDLEHVTASAPQPQTISGCQARPRPPRAARQWHLRQPRPHIFQRPRLERRLLAATVRSWDSGLVPQAPAAPGGSVLCLWVCWTSKRRNTTGCIHSSSHLR